jgi:hypothetical protein
MPVRRLNSAIVIFWGWSLKARMTASPRASEAMKSGSPLKAPIAALESAVIKSAVIKSAPRTSSGLRHFRLRADHVSERGSFFRESAS